MGIFDDLAATKGGGTAIDRLTPVSAQAAAALRAGGVPSDYLEFMEVIGYGELGEAAYMLYGGVVEPEEIYGERPPQFADILLLGDDFQGFNTGFDKKTWSIVEIDSSNMTARVIADNFNTFIRRKLQEL